METKLQDIIQRLNRRLQEARKFQDTLSRRITRLDADLAQLKSQGSERKKKTAQKAEGLPPR